MGFEFYAHPVCEIHWTPKTQKDDRHMKKMTHKNLSISLRIERLLWLMVYFVFFRFSPNVLFAYRTWLLKLFGAKIARGAHIYPNCLIWIPRNLVMHENSCIGPRSIVYNVSLIEIGRRNSKPGLPPLYRFP